MFDDAELIDESRLPDGKLFLATIRLQGQTLTLMNGGPNHKLTEAFSLAVSVETQEEVDAISDQLITDGGAQGPCGWLTDAFGVSWQVVPTLLMRLMTDPDPAKAGRTHAAMMQMKRLNLRGLQDAYDGTA